MMPLGGAAGRPPLRQLDFLRRGTLAPERRASLNPIAMACLRLVTFFPDRPERNLPLFISCTARFTLLWDVGTILPCGRLAGTARLSASRLLGQLRVFFAPSSCVSFSCASASLSCHIGRPYSLGLAIINAPANPYGKYA